MPAAGLVPVNWAKTEELPAGTLLAAAGTGELPVAVGVVSIPRRDTPGPHPSAPRYQRTSLPPTALTGSTVTGVGYRVEILRRERGRRGHPPGGRHPDDRWVPGAGQQRDQADFGKNRYPASSSHLSDRPGRPPGRGTGARPALAGRPADRADLGAHEGARPRDRSEFVSDHADVPPTVITADIPVLPHECGARRSAWTGRWLGW